MENFYIIIVGILFILAISDLIVGVSNDAVNFLNSAVGSKAAPRYIIMIVASIGIILGTTFSSGMMEVARKGIFHPDQFVFSEIMIIFLAVMLTDVLLLDAFNTMGLPTSTTVSIVFELLGAAVAVSIIKVINSTTESIGDIYKYINTEKALAIIGGILISVIVAFLVGMVVQYIVRVIFSFNYKKSYKYFGALWGGIAISIITYFILIKGAKGASFLSDNDLQWIQNNSGLIIGISFIGWTILLQLLVWISKINILKLIILVGTFALAMAFAGNDLVNFIGVPLAGLKSFQAFNADPLIGPDSFTMEALKQPVRSNTHLLIIAGLIMVITLWLSKKARGVTQTEVDLSRQDIGDERFGSSLFSRLIVRRAIQLNNGILKIIPKPAKKFIDKRFEEPKIKTKKIKEKGAYDLVRATVNLTVASILIAFATSLKLPLSTTYVTFMVAMGTSLSDRAWGRDSAVYRITGVATVIGGWFVTALLAFTAALIMAFLIFYGGKIAIGILIILAIYLIIRTHKIHKRKETEKQEDLTFYKDITDEAKIVEKCTERISVILLSIQAALNKNNKAVINEDRKTLKDLYKEVEKINKQTKKIKNKVYESLSVLQNTSGENEHFYVQVTDYLREISNSLSYIVSPCFEHFENHHKGFSAEMSKELKILNTKIHKFISLIIEIVNTNKFSKIENAVKFQYKILELIDITRKNQVKRIKNKDTGTKVSLLYLNILNELKNITLQLINLLKAQRNFIENSSIQVKEEVLVDK